MFDCTRSAHLSSDEPLVEGRQDKRHRARSERYSPDERLAEMAAVLATGLLRLNQRAGLPAKESPENPPRKPPEGLELSDRPRLSVCQG